MTDLKDLSREAKRLAVVFEATGAEVVELDFLQISNVLLDLSRTLNPQLVVSNVVIIKMKIIFIFINLVLYN